MSLFGSYGSRTFTSLTVPNFRLFFTAQVISQIGGWMQSVAQGLLVLDLTGSGTALGLVVALQTLPVLFLGVWGGVIADRLPKRQILIVTQIAFAALAALTGVLVATDAIQLWMVYATGLGLGVVSSFDNPARQTFVREMVGAEHLTNAVSLNSTAFNLARVIGPMIAGVLASTVGIAACFIADAVSYIPVLAALAMMKTDQLQPAMRVARAKGQLAEGLRYVKNDPVLFTPLLMMAIIGMFTYEFAVMLPVFAEFTLGTGPEGYASLTAAMGAGAVVGGLVTATRNRASPRAIIRGGMLFGASVLLVAFMPNLTFAILALIVVGFFSILFTSVANVTLQLRCVPEMQGRVMSLWSMAFIGTTPVGGPIMGGIAELASPRWALGIAGLAAMVAAVIGARLMSIDRSRSRPASV